MKIGPFGSALTLPFMLYAVPALADHPGPAAVGTASGALDVAGPDMLDRGGVALSLSSVLAVPEDRSDAVLEELAERDIHAHTSDYVLTTRLGASYGVTDRLMLSASLPLVHREDLREGEHEDVGGVDMHEVVPLGDVTGIGDLTLLAKYRLTGDDVVGVAGFAGLKLPTGATGAQRPEGERLETEHQPGSGSWDPIVGAAVGGSFGHDRVDASLFYQFAGTGAQDTRLGDRLQAGVAVAHRFGPGDHHDDRGGHAEAHGHTAWDIFASLAYESEGRETVAGEVEEESGGEVLWLSPGVRYTGAGGLALAVSLGVPLWQDIRLNHPDNDLRLSLSVALAM